MYEADNWEGDPHRYRPALHYRLYVGSPCQATVIEVQDYDYPDYDARRILSASAWDTRTEAEAALMLMLPALVEAERDVPVALEPGLRAQVLARRVREIELLHQQYSAWSAVHPES